MAGLRLQEEQARDVLLVRAIETEDAAASILTRDDRDYATAAARSSTHLGEAAGRRQTAAFMARRASLSLDRLISRYPMLQRARKLARWPQSLNWALPSAALIVGLAANAIEGQRLNILAFPLMGMLAWNLAVYAWLLFAWLRRSAGGRPVASPPPAIGWMLRPASAQLAGHPTLERAVVRFGQDWAAASARLNRSRASRALHFSAATFALGIVAGMFARARYAVEYTAGWAGTWAGAEAEVAAVLKVILGPASMLTGIGLPTVERLRELRGADENAGDWLYLWMVTAAVFVIAPRLLLALGSALRSTQLKRRLEIPHDFYIRRVLRDAIGRARNVRIIPYAFELAAEAGETLKHLLSQALGDKITVQIEASIAYGSEDEWVERHAGELSNVDHIILLFNLGSTPESENHGALAERLGKQLAGQAELTVLLDDSRFVHTLRGQASAPRRLEDRLQAWRSVFALANVVPIRVTLDSAADPDAARALEQALLQGQAAR
ncbi:MAG: hypothetical protein H0V46_05870 [Sphingomonas sp.]|nr:hypothetical protein [Sphingomonas sp.]